jgi:hypothetical protein
MTVTRFSVCPLQKIVPKVHNTASPAGITARMVNLRFLIIKEKTSNTRIMAQGGRIKIILIR